MAGKVRQVLEEIRAGREQLKEDYPSIPIFDKIFGEVDKLERRRRQQELESKVSRVRQKTEPFVTAIRREVINNWEFYLTVFVGGLLFLQIWRRSR